MRVNYAVSLVSVKSDMYSALVAIALYAISYDTGSWYNDTWPYLTTWELGWILLSGEPDYFGRKKISSGGDLSHYSSASLY